MLKSRKLRRSSRWLPCARLRAYGGPCCAVHADWITPAAQTVPDDSCDVRVHLHATRLWRFSRLTAL